MQQEAPSLLSQLVRLLEAAEALLPAAEVVSHATSHSPTPSPLSPHSALPQLLRAQWQQVLKRAAEEYVEDGVTRKAAAGLLLGDLSQLCVVLGAVLGVEPNQLGAASVLVVQQAASAKASDALGLGPGLAGGGGRPLGERL
jgi:hypothetical protein